MKKPVIIFISAVAVMVAVVMTVSLDCLKPRDHRRDQPCGIHTNRGWG